VGLRHDDLGEAAEIEEWVLRELAERQHLTRYERRLVAVFQLSEHVSEESAAIVASSWLAHRRDTERGARQSHVGEVGERLELEVLDVRETRRGSRHGRVFWHRLRDRQGREFAWFAVGRVLPVGAAVRTRARVRRHSRFAGRAVTVLERCRVLGDVQTRRTLATEETAESRGAASAWLPSRAGARPGHGARHSPVPHPTGPT